MLPVSPLTPPAGTRDADPPTQEVDLWWGGYAGRALLPAVGFSILFTVAAAAGAYFLIKGLLTGRRKLAEARPTITTIRRTAAGAEVGATKVSDTVAMPFIKARGLANAVKEGARALVGARDDQP